MNNQLEPPVLMSRLMTFVFAAALLVVVVLILTLSRLTPLSKTQVFFLTTNPRDNVEISIKTYYPSSSNIELYKENFIKEYIKARNEIIPNATAMQRKWGAYSDGMVYSWSSPEVYSKFSQTGMWVALMNDIPSFEFRCPVEFTKPIEPRSVSNDKSGISRYAVSFSYFCTNNDGQAFTKNYTIVLGLKFADTIKRSDRLTNPLGVQIVEYTIEQGGSDPLDFI